MKKAASLAFVLSQFKAAPRQFAAPRAPVRGEIIVLPALHAPLRRWRRPPHLSAPHASGRGAAFSAPYDSTNPGRRSSLFGSGGRWIRFAPYAWPRADLGESETRKTREAVAEVRVGHVPIPVVTVTGRPAGNWHSLFALFLALNSPSHIPGPYHIPIRCACLRCGGGTHRIECSAGARAAPARATGVPM